MITSIHAAMAKKREDIEKDEQGFTLIELLVVILIIGILAAIAIPVFLGQQDQAKDAAAKSDVANAKLALISYATAKNGDYTGATPATLADYGYVASDGVTLALNLGSTSGEFCISGTARAGMTFGVSETTSKVVEGACAADGTFTPKV